MIFEKEQNKYFDKKRTLNLGGELILIDKPLVMGILNVTRDSFYDGGKYITQKEIATRATEIVEQGAAIIDIGAVSTRPGAIEIAEKEEITNLLAAVKIVKKMFPKIPVSIDTYRASVAEQIISETGACIVNDISGGTMDERMFEMVAKLRVPYILMHIQGTPATMQQNPVYEDVIKEVIFWLSEKLNLLKLLGVNDVIIDPGFGFGKNIDHNYQLLNSLDAFRIFELPILAGISRKAMIWRLLEISPADALAGTTALNTISLLGGADILRVHDVKEAVDTVKIISKLKNIAQ